jgi:tRNA U34 5-methylaminomethyl-2-thiouridine-forming methyltransferase MnmC
MNEILHQIQTTSDGSPTLVSGRVGDLYHSRHGARTESEVVFIQAGLEFQSNRLARPICVAEIGLGTGLNAYLTWLWALNKNHEVWYEALEPFPLDPEICMDWKNQMAWEAPELWSMLHHQHPGENLVGGVFNFSWQQAFWPEAVFSRPPDVLFFDAFAPGTQPELWTKESFQHAFDVLSPDGILVTYCAKGEVKRNLKSAGFSIEALPGPPGKREITRALKGI